MTYQMQKPRFIIQLAEGKLDAVCQFELIEFYKFFCSLFSYGDISSKTMFQDMRKIFFGGFLMFIFMVVVLSKFGWIELRVSSIYNVHTLNNAF